MGKVNIQRTILRCLAWRPSAGTVDFLGSQQVSRLCQSVVNADEQKALISLSDRKVKIGKRIYLIKSLATSPASKLNGEAKPSKHKEVKPSKDKFHVSQKRRSIMKLDSSVVKEDIKIDSNVKCKQPPSVGNIISRQQVNDTDAPRHSEVNRGQYSVVSSVEGLEQQHIGKHPLYQAEDIKPFLSINDTNLRLLNTPRDHFFHGSLTRDVLLATQSVASLQRSMEIEQSNLGSGDADHLMRDLRQTSLDFDNLTKDYLSTGDATLSVVNPIQEAFWESLKPERKKIKNIQLVSAKVVHPELRYVGSIDCIGTYESEPALIEFSAKSKQHFSLSHRGILNIVALAGAVNFDPRFPVQVKNLIVISAFADGSPAHVQLISPNEAAKLWEKWLIRLKQYWQPLTKPTLPQRDLRHISIVGTTVKYERRDSLPTDEKKCAESIHQAELKRQANIELYSSGTTSDTKEKSMNPVLVPKVEEKYSKDKTPAEEDLLNKQQKKIDLMPKGTAGVFNYLWSKWKL